jgi:S-adenosylmethionine hydrolase
VETEITYVDSFGNLRLAGGAATLRDAFGELAPGTPLRVTIGAGTPLTARFAPSFGHVEAGATLVYVDSAGGLAIADNQADLAARIGARPGLPVRLEAS